MRLQRAFSILVMGVSGCLALKASYRDQLRAGAPQLRIVYLEGDYELLSQRLEPPLESEAIRLHIGQAPAWIVDQAFEALSTVSELRVAWRIFKGCRAMLLPGGWLLASKGVSIPRISKR